MNFKREWEKKFARGLSLLRTIDTIGCILLLDRDRVCVRACVIKLIVVFIYIRWHTNELSSCATSFPLCKHHIRLAVNVKRTNNVINVGSDGGLSLPMSFSRLKISWDMIIDIRLLLLLVSDNDKWVKKKRENEEEEALIDFAHIYKTTTSLCNNYSST